MRDVAFLLTDGALLAQQPNNFGDTRSGSLAGPVGLFIIVLLAIATVLLIRNMNSRLRRLPDRFPAPGAGETPVAGSRDVRPEAPGVDRSGGERSDSTSEGP